MAPWDKIEQGSQVFFASRSEFVQLMSKNMTFFHVNLSYFRDVHVIWMICFL